MKIIKQFGLQRSGTNVLKALVELNFQNVFVLSNYLGNKHNEVTWDILNENMSMQEFEQYYLSKDVHDEVVKQVGDKTIMFLFNLKDPVSWLASYYRYQKKKVQYKNPNATFLLDINFAKKSLNNWRLMILSWEEFVRENPRNCIVVQHEDILLKPKQILKKIENNFELKRNHHNLISKIEGYAKRGTDKEHGTELIIKKKRFDPSYHTKGEWIHDIPDDVKEHAIDFSRIFFQEHPSVRKMFDLSHLNNVGIKLEQGRIEKLVKRITNKLRVFISFK